MSLNGLTELFAAGGVVMWPLFFSSVLAVSLTIERLLFWVKIYKRQQQVAKEALRLYRLNNVVNRQPTTIEALTEQLRALVGNNQDVLVVVNADEQVNLGSAVAVMDKVRQIPGAKLAIATKKPK